MKLFISQFSVYKTIHLRRNNFRQLKLVLNEAFKDVPGPGLMKLTLEHIHNSYIGEIEAKEKAYYRTHKIEKMFNSPEKIAAWAVVGAFVIGVVASQFVKIKK